jgi:hypothetical protein
VKIKPELYHIKLTDVTSWGCDSIDEFNKEQAKFKKLKFLELEQYDESKSYQTFVSEDEVVLSKNDVILLNLAEIRFTIKSQIDVDVDISEQLQEWANKPIKISADGGNTYNNKCEVHMPGQALSMYNEVSIQTDLCTDELQTYLNSGWRIIAACPQPDQRRPDYIMGRFNPNIEIDGSATR